METTLPPLAPVHIHIPAVSSPLNPEVASSKARTTKPIPPREREPREKRETLKKREAGEGGRLSTSTVPAKRKKSDNESSAPCPKRYNVDAPRLTDYQPARHPGFASHEPTPLKTPDGKFELMKPLDQYVRMPLRPEIDHGCANADTSCRAENKRGYRYTNCIADPQFKHKQYYRATDVKPYGPCMSFADADKWMHFDTSGRFMTNQQGWRMARANVCAREGSFYYEVRIVRGVVAEVPTSTTLQPVGPEPHVRMGWARREAPLDGPVGFDAYSYGLTDARFETMHRSRPGKFIQTKLDKSKTKPMKEEASPVEKQDSIREGDVIGLEIVLPSLRLHQKIVSGIYNPAVDLGDGFDDTGHVANDDPDAHVYDVIRDRIPIPYKSNMFFQTMDHVSSKAMHAYCDRTFSLSSLSSSSTPSAGGTSIKVPPNPNHIDPTLRTLPHSSIRVYKNGLLTGTAFENLLAFLPPASAPDKADGAREGFDDGMVGYFPAVACFSGGMAEVNFGHDGFWFPPAHLQSNKGSKADQAASAKQSQASGRAPRPVGERYTEQIAEDIVWDLVDEVDFWTRDAWDIESDADDSGRGSTAIKHLKQEAD